MVHDKPRLSINPKFNKDMSKQTFVKRYDFMLQEHGLESFVKTVGVLQSHTSYWKSKDVSHFILMKIHNEKIDLRKKANK